MFDRSVRRHPVQTFHFWFVVLMSFVLVTAWKLDFFTFSREQLPIVSEEPMPPPPRETARVGGDVLRAPIQSERSEQLEESPKSTAATLASIPRELASMDHAQELKTPAAPPAKFERIIRTASLETGPSPSPIIPVKSEATVEEPAAAPLRMAPPAPLEPVNLQEVERLIVAGEDVPALRLLSNWYWTRPDARPQIMSRLQLLSRRIYFSPEPHYAPPYLVQFGDRLETIAKKYQLTAEYLAKLNRIEARKLRATQPLKVMQGPFAAVIDLSDFELTVHCQGYYLASFPVGLGTDLSIPEGKFRVTDKVLNPDYHGPRGVIPHLDPANPLGQHWLSINDDQYSLGNFGIHGTSDEASLGKIGSAGCIRLKGSDIGALYDLLTVGSEVIIHP